jgi:SAM-dependent methyltransferase
VREQRRTLFDSVAELYDAARQGYPGEIVDAVLANAAVGRGGAVLEIGCGTGQLTRQLAGRALRLTAIDIGPAMVQVARRNVADSTARFQVCSFEDFAGCGPFDLIVSATAFHWVDPGVGLAKAAWLLRPGGWPSQPAWLTALQDSGLFGAPVEVSHTRALRLPAETVIGVERTRATFLSYTEQNQAGFTADLQTLVMPGSQIDLLQETFLAMAQTAA